MVGASLLAKNAIEKGLKVQPYIKTTLSPGSILVTSYLKSANLLEPLEQLGFYLAGYVCMTCIGNSGDLDTPVTDAISQSNLVAAAAVLSGNRNFEGRARRKGHTDYAKRLFNKLSSILLYTTGLSYTILSEIMLDSSPIQLDASGLDPLFTGLAARYGPAKKIDIVITTYSDPLIQSHCSSDEHPRGKLIGKMELPL